MVSTVPTTCSFHLRVSLTGKSDLKRDKSTLEINNRQKSVKKKGKKRETDEPLSATSKRKSLDVSVRNNG